MKTILRPQILIAAFLLALASFGPLAAQPADVNLRGLGGASLTSADVARGNAVLVIWTSWSPRCRDIVERVNALQQKWGGKAKILAVSFNEDSGDVERFLAGKGLSVPVLLDTDGAFSKKRAITVLPGLIVIQNGQVTYAGKLPDAPESVLAGLLGG